MRRGVLLALAILALGAGCGGSHRAATTTTSEVAGQLLTPPVAAPAFALVDQHGRLLGPRDLRGNWFVVAFLYTHCPDVCPLIASNLAIAQTRLPKLDVLAVSVDPKGDTPKAVRAFVRNHRLGARFHYLTGTQAQLEPVWRKYHVAAVAGTTPVVSHSAFELLVDRSGRERVLYDAQLKAADLTHDVALLTR